VMDHECDEAPIHAVCFIKGGWRDEPSGITVSSFVLCWCELQRGESRRRGTSGGTRPVTAAPFVTHFRDVLAISYQAPASCGGSCDE